MLTLIIAAGLGFLVAAGVHIGQQRGQDRAWRAIAVERRALHETRTNLDALADDLVEEGLRLQEWEARLVIASERALRRDGPGSP